MSRSMMCHDMNRCTRGKFEQNVTEVAVSSKFLGSLLNQVQTIMMKATEVAVSSKFLGSLLNQVQTIMMKA